MRFGIVVVLTLAVGSLAAHYLLADNGYVLVHFRGYAIEMSVPVLAFVLFAAYLAVRLLVRIWHTPRQVGEAAARIRQDRAGRNITRGLAALAEGKLSRGERLLTKSARASEMPLLHYLEAARAAQMQGDGERRDGWLKMAYDESDETQNAILLTQAQLQLANGEYEQARASLNRVRETRPEHPEAVRLLARLHEAEGDWDALAALLPLLRRQRNMRAGQLDDWTVRAFRARLEDNGEDRNGVETIWQELPRNLRKEPSLVRARIRALVTAGDDDDAETEIRKALRRAWDGDLVSLYGQLETGNAAAQLRHAESWLRDRPEDPELLLTAGRLCMRNELWGKARSYLESSVAIRPTPAAYHEMGRLMLRIGEQDTASEAFQKGLTLSSGLPGLPRLAADGNGDASAE